MEKYSKTEINIEKMENLVEDEVEEKIELPEDQIEDLKSKSVFKKPILIGKIGRLPKRLPAKISEISEVYIEKNSDSQQILESESKETVIESGPIKNPEQAPSSQIIEKENPLDLPYKEPVWSGLPDSDGKHYSFEVLKSGSIIETINLMDKTFWVFGRLAYCNIYMQHPTISRYHAVLQYRKEASETDGPGFYIYDLGSTHGTFLNKNRLKPKVFVRMQVGHILKLGCSTRSYILDGPEYDEEEESELSVTELKQKRDEEIRRREEEVLRIQKEIEDKKKKEEEKGVDWGLGEDADEETDLSENPYAQTNNEELYLDDPKKALRGFFEREGLNLEYTCNEQGIGQFLCKVELPVDDEMGRPIIAEVLHKGKKKEAVIQCALEACRILDRYGVLRQATHESRKRKAKNWEENDYYDSDEDTFLDRTGTIEKKREKRMNVKGPQKVETYESLVAKEKCIITSITDVETQISTLQAKIDSDNNQNNDEDSLDSYMKELKDSKPDKKSIIKLKAELTKLKGEHSKVMRLINIAKPAFLPPLMSPQESSPSTSKECHTSSLPIFGKRKKIQFKFEQKSKYDLPAYNELDDEEEEIDENGDEVMKIDDKEKITDEQRTEKQIENKENPNETKNTHMNENVSESNENVQEIENVSSSSSSSTVSDEEAVPARGYSSLKCLHNTMTFKKFENILKKGLPPYADKHQDKLEKILNNLKKLATNEDRMHVDWKMLAAKKKKVMKLISDMKHYEPNEKLEHRVSSELNRILVELNTMTEQKYKVLDKVKKMGNEIQNISEAIEKDLKDYKKEVELKHVSKKPEEAVVTSSANESTTAAGSADKQISESSPSTSDRLTEKEVDPFEESTENDNLTDEKKKKKNQRRNHQRQEKQEQERQRGYEEDAVRENYSMWVPPNDQSGDGRTNLNEKYGY